MVKKAKQHDAPEEGTPPVEHSDVVEKDTKDTADVVSKNGVVVRTYSKELHGSHYKELAKEFAAKRGHSVK